MPHPENYFLNNLPEERGLEEEGLFDIFKPMKRAMGVEQGSPADYVLPDGPMISPRALLKKAPWLKMGSGEKIKNAKQQQKQIQDYIKTLSIEQYTKHFKKLLQEQDRLEDIIKKETKNGSK